MGTSVGDIITGLTVEGLSSVTNYFAAKSSNAFNALQKMEEVDKYFKEEFLQGAQYSKEIKEFYVSNNKALEAANAIGIRDGKGTEGAGKLNNMTPSELNKLTPDQIKKALPDGWTYSGSPDGRFTHIKDSSGNYRIRIDPADKVTAYPHMHIFDDVGNALDINGNIVPANSIDAHIPR